MLTALLLITLGPGTPKISADVSQMKTLEGLTRKYEQVAKDNYGMIVRVLQADKFVKDEPVKIIMDEGYNGVAATENRTIHVDPKYAIKHPEDLGMIVHELTHVVQDYEHGDNPGWLVEGVADYVRWFSYEPVDKRPHPKKGKADAKDAYRTTAHFLDFVTRTYNKELVPKLNTAMHDGVYTEDIWKTLTGKTLDELDAEWKATL